MSEWVKPMAEWCAAIIEALGIGLITATALYVLCFAICQVIKGVEAETLFGYPFKAGHFVSSITYREGLMALPWQG